MSDKRRGLGRGLGALIPSGPSGPGGRPVDVMFGRTAVGVLEHAERADADDVSRETWATEPPTDRHGDPERTSASEGDGVEHGGAERGSGNSTADVSGPAVAGGVDDGLRAVPGAWFAEIPVGQVRSNPRQPRTVFDDDEMAELVDSVREIGVLQPIVVRPVAADEQGAVRFEIVMGERRWRACIAAGLTSVPAIVKDTADDDLLRDALLENLHRSQLNALEEAAAYQQLLDDFGCTHDELATRIGRSRPQISNTLRLLKLPPLVARRVAAGVLSAGHARALLGLSDGAAVERLAQRIVAEGLSVRTVEEIVTFGGEESPRATRRPRNQDRQPHLDDLAATLSDRLDTTVRIAMGQRKGRLTVDFATLDDLARIIDLLGDGAASPAVRPALAQ